MRESRSNKCTKVDSKYCHPKEFVSLEPEELENINKNNLPYIKIKIQDITIYALVDTGSQVSLIKESIIMKNKQKFNNNLRKINKMKILTANDKKIAENAYCKN